MRTILALGITTLLLATVAGAALAQAPDGAGSQAAERRAKADALRAARNDSLAMFHENRTDAIDDYRAANNATKQSFLENKTAVIDACRAARNATADDNNSDYSKCVSDGLRPLIQKARDEHQAHRQAFVDRMMAARQAALAHFREQRTGISGA